jgi:CheY-like chemotaxis protein
MKSAVLIVEDDDDIREIISSVLAHNGYRILTAADGGEALEQLEKELPSLILLDLMMPHMSGEEFRQRQLQDERWAAIPVVVLSGGGDLRDAGRRMKVEAIGKPIELKELISTVARYCGSK